MSAYPSVTLRHCVKTVKHIEIIFRLVPPSFIVFSESRSEIPTESPTLERLDGALKNCDFFQKIRRGI